MGAEAAGAGSLYLLYLVSAAVGYVLGSVPFGLVLTRIAGLGDVRDIGSGNIGATNVLRTGNKPLAAATLILDVGKGGVAAIILAMTGGEDMGLVAGFAAVLGHNFPFWLQFKGGKGVATTLGVLLATMWPVGVAACLTWLAAAALFRMSSLAALVALGAAPVYAFYFDGPHQVWLAAALAVLSFVRHRANIGRIVKGEESRIRFKKE